MNGRKQSHAGYVVAALLAAFLAAPATAEEPDWDTYDSLLSAYVHRATVDGIEFNSVDYTALGADPRWGEVVRDLEAFSPGKLRGRDESLAFYINAYNIFALRMVLDHWPIDSIKDAGNLFLTVWKKPAGLIAGRSMSLDALEDDRLRRIGDPRIHMAIVCASLSCPDLRTEAYRGKNLDQQLDDQTRRFLANPTKGLRLEGETVHISKIFKWFRKDFREGVSAFIGLYRELPADANIETDIDYDWRLNGSVEASQE